MMPLPPIIKLLSHELRWSMVQALTLGDYRVNELVTMMDQPLNTVSYHLKLLREGNLIAMRPSEADGRDNYYSLDLDQLGEWYRAAGFALHPSVMEPEVAERHVPSSTRVLFVCTHNSARSQMAEGLLRHLSGGQIQVKSAGSQPTTVHSDAIRTMASMGIDIREQQSSGFDDVINDSFDVVITVCDRAREVCPAFPGEGQHIHWGFPDPAAIEETDERQRAFTDVARRLRSRVSHFLTHLSKGIAA